MKPPLPFPFALNIGTDIVHLPRIARLLTRNNGSYFPRFTRRILHAREQADFHARFAAALQPTQSLPHNSSSHTIQITPEMTRWLAGRFAAKEAARKAAPRGAAQLGWKDVIVRVSEVDEGRPEVVYLDSLLGGEGGGRVGKLSISHDGEYVVAMVLAAG
ncbi:holo-ACP synthase [Aspergillus homomorphus CBS 101889]|uniref:Phosphopantetheinyl transferase PptB n=1 Tax=Aspergillus homomorphus (strain CBS 101889) TaxID=1450537 RepID=A0A395I187_ASPHC|nr:phosphopantetheinyl transferase PptB [Aspergillus homomorphus CBS 101889]RAL13687.1 phosphopantetheinyl transferase PptB [Aspergillus homomorphus CBS 101889]